MSAVVVGELLYGFRQGSRLEQSLVELRSFLDRPYVSFVPVGPVTADRYSRIMTSLRARGRPIPTNDVWIAAHAMETGADLRLMADSHFGHVDQVVWVSADAGLRTARSHRGDDSMESMRNRMRSRRLRGLVLHHRRHPSAHPRRLVTRTASWGDPPVRGRLSLVPRAHRRNTSHLARLLPCGIPRRIRTETTSASRSRCARAVTVLPRSSTTGLPSTSPGRLGPEALRRSVHTGEPPLAMQPLSQTEDEAGPQAGAVPFGLLAGLARSPAGLENQPAHGRACSSLLSGIVDAGKHADAPRGRPHRGIGGTGRLDTARGGPEVAVAAIFRTHRCPGWGGPGKDAPRRSCGIGILGLRPETGSQLT